MTKEKIDFTQKTEKKPYFIYCIKYLFHLS